MGVAWVLDKGMDTERHWGAGQGTGCAGRPLTGLPALGLSCPGGSLQGCVLLLALFPGTSEVQKILASGGLMNARLWPQCQAMEPGNAHILAAFLPFFLQSCTVLLQRPWASRYPCCALVSASVKWG